METVEQTIHKHQTGQWILEYKILKSSNYEGFTSAQQKDKIIELNKYIAVSQA